MRATTNPLCPSVRRIHGGCRRPATAPVRDTAILSYTLGRALEVVFWHTSAMQFSALVQAPVTVSGHNGSARRPIGLGVCRGQRDASRTHPRRLVLIPAQRARLASER
jgi:hypothetical protein